MNKPRRFIAGATCPACGLVDKLFIYQQGNKNYCKCSRCGAMPTMEKGGGLKDLTARSGGTTGNDVVDVVRILDGDQDRNKK
jgi:uncharacterized metal-binding protein (TIGR02443 family)